MRNLRNLRNLVKIKNFINYNFLLIAAFVALVWSLIASIL